MAPQPLKTCPQLCFWIVLLACAGAIHAQAANPALADGTIVEQAPCPFPRTYEAWIDFQKGGNPSFNEADFRKNFSPQRFEEGVKATECLRVKYMSDGLRVTGYVFKPADTGGRKYPVFVFVPSYLPGGQIRPVNVMNFFNRVRTQGLVVLYPAYRGNDGGEGRDEFGGAEVNDVINLVPLAQSQPYMDADRMVMYGGARGGMMIYLALAKGMRVRSAAVENTPTNVEAWAKQNPATLEALRKAAPDFEARAQEHYRSRSIIYAAEKINTPLFIRHGSGNKRIPATHALEFVGRLETLGKYYELVIYPNDDPDITLNDPEDDRRVAVWLKKYTQ